MFSGGFSSGSGSRSWMQSHIQFRILIVRVVKLTAIAGSAESTQAEIVTEIVCRV